MSTIISDPKSTRITVDYKKAALSIIGAAFFSAYVIYGSAKQMHRVDPRQLPEPMNIFLFSTLCLLVMSALIFLREAARYLVARSYLKTESFVLDVGYYPSLKIPYADRHPKKRMILSIVRTTVDVMVLALFVLLVSLFDVKLFVSPLITLFEFGIFSIFSMLYVGVFEDASMFWSSLKELRSSRHK